MSDTESQHGFSRAPVILVGVEPRLSDAVLLEAAHLAHDLGCELICAYVDPSRYPVEQLPDGSVRALPIDPDSPELDEEEFDRNYAARVEQTLAGHGVQWSMRALAGDPARALSTLAEQVNARMIVVGTHEPGFRAGVREFFHTSVAVHLAHRQHRPVLVIPLSPVTDGGGLPWE